MNGYFSRGLMKFYLAKCFQKSIFSHFDGGVEVSSSRLPYPTFPRDFQTSGEIKRNYAVDTSVPLLFQRKA